MPLVQEHEIMFHDYEVLMPSLELIQNLTIEIERASRRAAYAAIAKDVGAVIVEEEEVKRLICRLVKYTAGLL